VFINLGDWLRLARDFMSTEEDWPRLFLRLWKWLD
jgi:hypothetical protein